MLSYLYTYNIPFNIVATKADKISRGQINKQLNIIASTLGVGIGDIIVTSNQDKRGKDELLDRIENLL